MVTSNKDSSPQSRNLLIELGTEELPPKALSTLSEAFSRRLVDGLVEAGMVDSKQPEFQSFATPRRLALLVKGVLPAQPDRDEQRRGPALSAAYDADGNPGKAAEGFARSCGTEVAKLDTLKTDKGEWLAFNRQVKGQSLSEVLDQCLAQSIKQLPIPKRMRWGANEVEFVRPVHWLIVLHGESVVPTEVLGLSADRQTMGHRFHAPGQLSISIADEYAATLQDKGWVIADFTERRELIREQIEALADKADAEVVIDQDLLDLVTGLVEWPQAIYGEFDNKYLDVPKEVLVSSMRDHQKYFHLVDNQGQLHPGFITVSNIHSKSPERVIKGNERVLHARLADAEFFWNNDRTRSLASRYDDLGGVLFHKKLGSVQDKVERLQHLGRSIAEVIGADQNQVERSIQLCKIDLVTDMVAEFPDLQGTIGQYYAIHDGEAETVADAISAHYQPRFAGDELPSASVAQCVALSDRIDTLVGIFASGEIPTGDKDPYGLRRAALGVLRMMIEKELPLGLNQCLQTSIDSYRQGQFAAPELDAEGKDGLFQFMLERLRAWYQAEGFQLSEIQAVLALRPDSPLDFHHRLVAVQLFFGRHGEAAQSLAAANKRIANLLKKADQSELMSYNTALFSETAEQELGKAFDAIKADVERDFEQGDYAKAFDRLSHLRQPVDAFFDQVMVMTDDADIRNNRLALLASIRDLFLGAADISLLQLAK